jgi:hypothetical protein
VPEYAQTRAAPALQTQRPYGWVQGLIGWPHTARYGARALVRQERGYRDAALLVCWLASRRVRCRVRAAGSGAF